MFSFLKKNIEFFTPQEKQLIVEAVRNAEQLTSGEIRVYVESRCRYVDAMDKAREIFDQLKMDQTKDRNAVLVYIAIKDRQLAVLGDEGIHQKVHDEFWKSITDCAICYFKQNDLITGIEKSVELCGEKLKLHFPLQSDDKNELSNDISY